MSKFTSRIARLVACLTLVAVLSLAPASADAGHFGGHRGHGHSGFKGNFGHRNFGHKNFGFRINFGHKFHKSFGNHHFGSGFGRFHK